jgi:hypothetical protein
VLKGRLNWNQIEKDVFGREAGIEDDVEILDQEKIFYMDKGALTG